MKRRKKSQRKDFQQLTELLAQRIEQEGPDTVARTIARATVNLYGSYSSSNVVALAAQYPGVSWVMGYRGWQELGYQVRKGERALWILAPRWRKTGEDEEGNAERELAGFITVPVFDVSQTDAPPEAHPSPRARVRADEESLKRAIAAVSREIAPVRLVERSDGRYNGMYEPGAHRITLYAGTPGQMLLTLAHEAAHALLHRSDENHTDARFAEVEADLAAYLVAEALGLEGHDEAAVFYLTRYLDEPRELFTALRRSAGAAMRIIDAITGKREAPDAAA